jgi:hypothetical protein
MRTSILVDPQMNDLWFSATTTKKAKNKGKILAMRCLHDRTDRAWLIGSPPVWHLPSLNKSQLKAWRDADKVSLTVEDLGNNSHISEFSEGKFYILFDNYLVDPLYTFTDTWPGDRIFTFPYPDDDDEEDTATPDTNAEGTEETTEAEENDAQPSPEKSDHSSHSQNLSSQIATGRDTARTQGSTEEAEEVAPVNLTEGDTLSRSRHYPAQHPLGQATATLNTNADPAVEDGPVPSPQDNDGLRLLCRPDAQSPAKNHTESTEAEEKDGPIPPSNPYGNASSSTLPIRRSDMKTEYIAPSQSKQARMRVASLSLNKVKGEEHNELYDDEVFGLCGARHRHVHDKELACYPCSKENESGVRCRL